MYYSDQRRQAVARGIFSLWAAWAISFGSIILLFALALVIKAQYVPILALGLEFILLAIDRRNSRSEMPVCFRIGYIAQAVLLLTAILILMLLPYIWSEGARELTGQPINPDNPLLPVLVSSPCCMLVTLYYLIRQKNANYCASCRRRNGALIDYGIVGNLYSKESSFQTKLLFVISILLTIVPWTYYFTGYINVNINTSDKYFFIGIPALIYLLSVVYLGSRYYNMWLYYCRNSRMETAFKRYGTTIRFLFISGDKILLKKPDPKPDAVYSDDLLIDTPLIVRTPFRENMPLHEAISFLRQAAPDIDEKEVKQLFVSRFPGLHNNIFHYAVYGVDMQKTVEYLGGEWLSLSDATRLVRSHLASTIFAKVLHRIYTVAMAWKTYDKHGFRLYPIKNYRPTFRLSDMHKWDVDYSDPRWLNISELNQDKPFFHIRRLWRKLIHGEND